MNHIQLAARAVLDTHDRLRRTYEVGDAFRLGPDNLPIDAAGWLAWCDNEYEPAYQAWKEAMKWLRILSGPEFPGNHPMSFRPYCERMLSELEPTEA